MRDRDIVAALVARDPDGSAAAYDRYAAGLYGYCRSLLGGPDEAPDAAQETFITAAAKVGELRSPDLLRPWLYAVARNACSSLRAQGRGAAADESELVGGRPETAGFTAEEAEQRYLVLTALAGLGAADREAAELVTRHDLDGADLAALLGVTVSQGCLLASRARGRLEQSLGPLLAARTGRRGCPELDELLERSDGDLTPPWRRRVSRHAGSCAACAELMHRALDPAMLVSLVPLASPPAAMRAHVLALLADDSPDAVEYRAWVVSQAGPFSPAGFPVQIAPAGWAARSGLPSRGRRGDDPEPDRRASRAQRPGRAVVAAVAGLLVLVTVGGGIAYLMRGGGRGRLTAGPARTSAPLAVPGGTTSAAPGGSPAPRSPSGKPVLARSARSRSRSPSSRPATSPASPPPPRISAPVLSEAPRSVVLQPGLLDAVGSFTLSAASGRVSYSISTDSPAVSVSVPVTGTVTPDQPLTVTVTYSPLAGALPAGITVNGTVISLTVG